MQEWAKQQLENLHAQEAASNERELEIAGQDLSLQVRDMAGEFEA